jgi:hypothetical protein
MNRYPATSHEDNKRKTAIEYALVNSATAERAHLVEWHVILSVHSMRHCPFEIAKLIGAFHVE